MKLTIEDETTTDPTQQPLIANLLIRSETEPTDPTNQPLDPELFTGKPEPSHVPCPAELDISEPFDPALFTVNLDIQEPIDPALFMVFLDIQEPFDPALFMADPCLADLWIPDPFDPALFTPDPDHQPRPANLELDMPEIDQWGAFIPDTEPLGAEILGSETEQFEADIFRAEPELFQFMEHFVNTLFNQNYFKSCVPCKPHRFDYLKKTRSLKKLKTMLF